MKKLTIITLMAAAGLLAVTSCKKGSDVTTRDFSSMSATTVANTLSATDVTAVAGEITTAGYAKVDILSDDDEEFTYMKKNGERYEFIRYKLDDDRNKIDDVEYFVLAPAGGITKDYIMAQVNTTSGYSNAQLDDDSNIIDGNAAAGTGTEYSASDPQYSTVSAFTAKLDEVLTSKYAGTTNALSFEFEVETANDDDFEILFARPAVLDDDAQMIQYITGIVGSLTNYEYLEIEAFEVVK